jgi:predicted ribosome quality control (RQC) complex YloA/Tae2 family protein
MYETFKQAEVELMCILANNEEYIIYDNQIQKYELWFHNQNHASSGLITDDGKHLEFARSLTQEEAGELVERTLLKLLGNKF